MHTITATLILDDAADPPRVSATVQVDGEVVAAPEQVSATDCMTTLAAFAHGDAQLHARLRSTIENTVARMQQLVEHAHSAQAAREAALAEWQQVLSDAAPGA